MSRMICSDCENKFSGENKSFQSDTELQSSCDSSKMPVRTGKTKLPPPRTSTPIQGQENRAPPNFSNSVNDFFYQSWKSGLHPHETTNTQEQQVVQVLQPATIIQTLPNVTQVVLVNPVIIQPLITPSFQQVGIMPDGTLVVIPTYMPCNGYLV